MCPPSSPAGDITQHSVVEEEVFLAVLLHHQARDAGGVVVHHHDTGAVQPLGLVHQQVAALIIHIVSNHKALWTKRIRKNKIVLDHGLPTRKKNMYKKYV